MVLELLRYPGTIRDRIHKYSKIPVFLHWCLLLYFYRHLQQKLSFLGDFRKGKLMNDGPLDPLSIPPH
jgi:hypothetical protein